MLFGMCADFIHSYWFLYEHGFFESSCAQALKESGNKKVLVQFIDSYDHDVEIETRNSLVACLGSGGGRTNQIVRFVFISWLRTGL